MLNASSVILNYEERYKVQKLLPKGQENFIAITKSCTNVNQWRVEQIVYEQMENVEKLFGKVQSTHYFLQNGLHLHIQWNLPIAHIPNSGRALNIGQNV